jgi:hypothetical protein
LADLSEEFISPFNLDQHIVSGVFFSGDDVAHLERQQVGHTNRRLRQESAHFDGGVGDVLGELAEMVILAALALVAEPVLGRQHAHDRLDDVVGNAQAHGAGTVAHLQLKAHHNHGFIGWDDLHQLGVGFEIVNAEGDRGEVAPGFGEVMGSAIGDALHQALLDLGERALGDEQVGIRPAEKAVDDRVDDQRGNFQAKLPIELLGLEQIEAGGIGQGVNEFAVGQLLDVGDVDFDDGSQVAGEGRAEIAPKTLVQRLQGPHLIFGDALGTLEVVDVDIHALAAGAPEDGGGGFLLHLAALDCGEQGIHFGLV